jgi:hypothetical protein
MKSLILAALILLSLVGCYEQPGAGQAPPQDVVEFVESQVAKLKDAKYDEFRENADAKTFDRESAKILTQISEFIPAEPPQSVKVVAFNGVPGAQGTNIAMEYRYRDSWFLIRASVRPVGGSLKLFAINVDELEQSAAETFDVSMKSKSALHYAVFLSALLVPIIILFATIQWARLGKFRYRWWWLVAILFGVTGFTLNWNQGDWTFAPLNLQLLGAGFFVPMKLPPLLWPLYVTVSLPLGAMLFLVRRRSLAAAKQMTVASQTP